MDLFFNDYVLIALLALALYFDITRKKVPNLLTLPAAALGIAFFTFSGRLDGFLFSSLGLLAGGALLIIPFALGGIGGGDVKLLGAIGALKGAGFVLEALLFTALCGGIMAAVYLAVNGELSNVFRRFTRKTLAPAFFFLFLRFRLPLFYSLSAGLSSYSSEESVGVPEEKKKRTYLPYAVPIALGTLLVLSGLGEQVVPLQQFVN